jgi:hypothetical protein
MEVVIVIVEVFFFMVCIVFWFMIVNGYEQRRWWRLWIGKVLSGKWLFEYGGMKVGYGGWRWWFVMCLWVKKTQLCCCYSLFFSLFWVKTLFGKLCVFVVRVLIFFLSFLCESFCYYRIRIRISIKCPLIKFERGLCELNMVYDGWRTSLLILICLNVRIIFLFMFWFTIIMRFFPFCTCWLFYDFLFFYDFLDKNKK